MKILTACLAIIHGSCAITVQAKESTPPLEVFTFAKVKIGITTIIEAQNLFGKSIPYRSAMHDEEPKKVCYAANTKQGLYYIIFESGAMGGFSRITKFILDKKPPPNKCPATKMPDQYLKTGNNIEIGQSRNEFLRRLPINFRINGDMLQYTSTRKREATPDEVKTLKEMWPHEKSLQFDVQINIQAYFENNHLSRYEVSKTETY